MFSEVRTLLHTLLTVPVTTAMIERTFSTLCHLKILRSTMTQPRLNHVMLLHIYEGTDKLNIFKALQPNLL